MAEDVVAKVFSDSGWRVLREPRLGGILRPDLAVRRGGVAYAVEIKAAPEGRSDRLVPLWAQAWLQAAQAADDAHWPLAIVAAPRIPASAAARVLQFAEKYVPGAAAGAVDFAGLRQFRGPQLEELNSSGAPVEPQFHRVRSESRNLFSDLNQWMLKVLLAPHLPEHLLSAPRGQYRNASQLARAADVSVMSAFRLVESLRDAGHLAEGEPLELVRREELLLRWQESASRRGEEVPMRLLLRGDSDKEVGRILKLGHACLALFAAADALHLGFVSGVPPYVYASDLRSASLAKWKNVAPALPGEVPDLILRQAPARQSVFRGAVRVGERLVSDVLQVWLDVASHPSRGREQADLIRRRALNDVMAAS
jgi:hypothetical protein